MVSIVAHTEQSIPIRFRIQDWIQASPAVFPQGLSDELFGRNPPRPHCSHLSRKLMWIGKRENMNNLKRKLAGIGFAGALFFAGCAGDEHSKSTGQSIDDTAIHAKVKTELLKDPVVSGTKIGVQVDRGAVVLNGVVNGEVEKKKAEDIARGVDGVKSVENNIIVRK
jgi:hyperosmotically inducible protein